MNSEPYAFPSRRPNRLTAKGMVAAGQLLAAQAGLDIRQQDVGTSSKRP